MRDIRDIKAAVVGTGFIGVVHVEALRRLGRRGHRRRRLDARARGREGPDGRAAAAVPELRGDARRPRGRGRPPHHAQPPALRAGARGARRRQARRLREAAGDELGARRPSCCGCAERAGSSTRSTSTSASTRSARRRGRACAAGEVGDVRLISGGYLQDWLLLRHRLELAAGAGRWAARCARSATSARTGSISCSSSPAAASRP